MKIRICMTSALWLCASYTADAQPSASTSMNAASKYTSGNPVCAVDVKMESKFASRGVLTSARKLRDYYWDCVREGYQEPLKRWALVAAKLGGLPDQKDYMRILVERRFEGGEKGWDSPASCGHVDPGGAYRDEATKVHSKIAYYVQCEGKGVSRQILKLAQAAAAHGGADDVQFYADLVRVRHRAER